MQICRGFSELPQDSPDGVPCKIRDFGNAFVITWQGKKASCIAFRILPYGFFSINDVVFQHGGKAVKEIPGLLFQVVIWKCIFCSGNLKEQENLGFDFYILFLVNFKTFFRKIFFSIYEIVNL